jgi:uncharacterized protein (DUF2141 family)
MKMNMVMAALVLIGALPQTAVQSEQGGNSGTLRVLITGFTSDEGSARAAVYSSEDSFLDISRAYAKVVLPIEGARCMWVIEDIPYGEYALVAYHDKNNNDQFDTNVVGVPREDYGFSNGARGIFGPANYNNAKISMDSALKEIEIAVRDESLF